MLHFTVILVSCNSPSLVLVTAEGEQGLFKHK